MEKALPNTARRTPVGCLPRNYPAFDRNLVQASLIVSAAVIFDFDVNVIAAVVGAQQDISGRRLARGNAVNALLDAVRHGVAHEVYEWIGNLLNDIVVELGFTSGKIQLHALAGRVPRIANGPRQSRIQRSYRNHSRGRNLVLQMMRQLREFVDIAFDAADEPFQLRKHLIDVR